MSKPTLRVAYTSGAKRFDLFASKLFLQTISNEQDVKIRHIVTKTVADAFTLLKEKNADLAIAPFYAPKRGYEVELLREMKSLYNVVATELIAYRPRYNLIALADETQTRDIKPDQSPQSFPALATLYASLGAMQACPTLCRHLTNTGAQVITVASDDEALKRLRAFSQDSADGLSSGAIVNAHAVTKNSRFRVLKSNVHDAQDDVAYFIGVKNAKDKTAFQDKHRTTDAATRYFSRRMREILNEAQEPPSQSGAVAGMNILIQFSRDNKAAGIGDIQSYLRNFGVRYNIIQYPTQPFVEKPEPVLLDIEFDRRHFSYNPVMRLRGSIVNGALKMSLSRWKKRKPVIIGMMPVTSFRIPAADSRKWWREGATSASTSFGETMFIRFSRLLLFGSIMAGAAYAVFLAAARFL